MTSRVDGGWTTVVVVAAAPVVAGEQAEFYFTHQQFLCNLHIIRLGAGVNQSYMRKRFPVSMKNVKSFC